MMCGGHYVIVTFDRDLSSADICNANWMTKVSVQSSVKPEVRDLRFVNPNLNDSQKSAVQNSISNFPLAIIHGPPGNIVSLDFLFIDSFRHRKNYSLDRDDFAISSAFPRCPYSGDSWIKCGG